MDKKNKKLTVFCYRTADEQHKEPYYRKYEVEIDGATSALNVLREIFTGEDPTLAFFDHAACGQGACRRCAVRVNGKNRLACITDVSGEPVLFLEPSRRKGSWRDLFCR